MFRSGLVAAFCGLVVLVGSPVAMAQSTAERLSACMERIETDAEGAYEDGLAWMHMGAPVEARQCTALALIGLEQYAEGAARLETLANANDAGGLEARAIYLAQAGNAWLLAGAPEAAIVTLSNAVKLAPRDADLRIDRGRAYLVMKDWQEAGSEMDVALELSPGHPDALRLRAKVLMETGRLEEAWEDIQGSLEQDSSVVETLLLRGQIREAMRVKGLPDPVDG